VAPGNVLACFRATLSLLCNERYVLMEQEAQQIEAIHTGICKLRLVPHAGGQGLARC
jgi:hypothetical protein